MEVVSPEVNTQGLWNVCFDGDCSNCVWLTVEVGAAGTAEELTSPNFPSGIFFFICFEVAG